MLKHNLIVYLKPCTDSPLTAMSSRAVPEGRQLSPGRWCPSAALPSFPPTSKGNNFHGNRGFQRARDLIFSDSFQRLGSPPSNTKLCSALHAWQTTAPMLRARITDCGRNFSIFKCSRKYFRRDRMLCAAKTRCMDATSCSGMGLLDVYLPLLIS